MAPEVNDPLPDEIALSSARKREDRFPSYIAEAWNQTIANYCRRARQIHELAAAAHDDDAAMLENAVAYFLECGRADLADEERELADHQLATKSRQAVAEVLSSR